MNGLKVFTYQGEGGRVLGRAEYHEGSGEIHVFPEDGLSGDDVQQLNFQIAATMDQLGIDQSRIRRGREAL